MLSYTQLTELEVLLSEFAKDFLRGYYRPIKEVAKEVHKARAKAFKGTLENLLYTMEKESETTVSESEGPAVAAGGSAAGASGVPDATGG